ncbi:MAG TPA: hypothetical protein VIC30_02940, partial [Orrella sp.]
TFDAGDGSIDLSHPDNYFPSGVDANGSSIVITGDSNAASSQNSAGTFYQEVVAEFEGVRLADSTARSIVTGDVLLITETDEQQITMALCTSSQSSASLACASQ